MTGLWIAAVITVATLLLLAVIARRQARPALTAEDALHALLPVDLEAFRRLFDLEDAQFLQSSLSPGQYRRVQRQRTAAALHYLWRVVHNAGVLARLGQVFESSPHSDTAASARQMTQVALSVRFRALLLMTHLAMHWALGAPAGPALAAVAGYEQLKQELAMFGLRLDSGAMSKLYAAL